MKLQTLILLGAALIALDAVQASYAASDVYFPTVAEQATPLTSKDDSTALPRADVHADTSQSAKDLRAATWHEFGTVWHDDTLSSQTRAQVAAEAVQAAHSQTRSNFSY